MVGARTSEPRLRLYLAGPLGAERGGRVMSERDIPSRQARRLLAYLVAERASAASRDSLVELLWPAGPPASSEASLKALVSKVRSALAALAPPAAGIGIRSQFGCYQLELPADAWVDVEAARASLDEAEGALRRGSPREAWGPANVAVTVARRGFLAGEDGAWVEAKRRELEALLLRALDAYAGVTLAIAQPALAADASEQATRLDPLREPSWRLLMRAHAALGSRAEALRAFHRLRERLREDLGVSPSAETDALYTRILREAP